MIHIMQLDQTIFKAYDIRGIYPAQLNEALAEKIGKAFAVFIKKQSETGNRVKVALGRDTRLSSVVLYQAAMRGILSQGVDVEDIGLVSSDVMYFSVGHYEYDGGMMVSASHNPKEYNGFKMIARGVRFIGINFGLSEIKDLVLKDRWQQDTIGIVTQKSVIDDYIKSVISHIDIANMRPYTVVIDTGNGMAGVVARPLLEKLPCAYIPVFEDLDGNFPNRNPNPLTPGALDQLVAEVKKTSADVGVAFDADGDRMFLADERGNVIRNDLILAMVAKIVLQKQPGSAIVYNITCSHTTAEMIQEAGGKPVGSKTGHTFIKEAMKAHNAAFGGEVSGHFYFRENFYSESGFLALLMVLQAMSETGKKLSELAGDMDRYFYQPEINMKVGDRDAVIAMITSKYADGKHNELDGLTVEYDDYWFNVRKSNTEPLVRLVVEAKTQALRDQKIAELLELIGGEVV